ncbi:unnamed protein product [Trichogramma brassicae]|uniref:Uncharacterized protein n=1 Tax=Trichogramma brassicae TaxID=86971 RepID=A0A6H5I6X0_9HYME|nr:unnamed protein product [Trichogramma brassicae]
MRARASELAAMCIHTHIYFGACAESSSSNTGHRAPSSARASSSSSSGLTTPLRRVQYTAPPTPPHRFCCCSLRRHTAIDYTANIIMQQRPRDYTTTPLTMGCVCTRVSREDPRTMSNSQKLKIIRQIVIRNMKEDRYDLNRICLLIENWEGPYPDLRKTFRPKEMDWILGEIVYYEIALDFVIRSGYKDKPEVDRKGKPLLHRRTPMHHVARDIYNEYTIRKLFKIYNRFDVNYTDETGYTHFHVACEYGCVEAIEKFLELGQDPNVVWRKTGDTPLHLTLSDTPKEVAEMLLRGGADYNIANANGTTPLHIICGRYRNDDFIEEFFGIYEDEIRTARVDARDNSGNTPLHMIVNKRDFRRSLELLLRRGADPNAANEEGSTPLHFICKNRYDAHESARLFFEISKEINRPVLVDARDNLGRTPLQMAVANILPRTIDVLLDHGADLSSFAFLTESDFEVEYDPRLEVMLKLRLASSLMAVVERLEKRGYELDQGDVLTIMELFSKYELFEKSTNLVARWYDVDEWFVVNAKKIVIIPDQLSLYDLIKLQPREAAKQLTIADYHELASIEPGYWQMLYDYQEVCFGHLCQKLSTPFFRRWALDAFTELTRCRLPILCCHMIVEKLTYKDFWRLCLANAEQRSADRCREILNKLTN